MFPGVSTLHRHAKYFSLLPILFRDAVKKRYLRIEDVRPAIREMEIKMTELLCEGSSNPDGITGRDSLKGNYVKYDPVYIYGNALRTYGIVRTDNLEEAIFAASKEFHKRPVKLSATDQEQGDSNEVDSLIHFCVCPSDLEYNWRSGCSLELTAHEASFVRDHILSAPACENTLLQFILENELDLRDDQVSTLESFLVRYGRDLPEKYRKEIRMATCFSDLVDGLFLYYNWLYSEKKDGSVWEDFQKWREDVFMLRYTEMEQAVTTSVINDYKNKTKDFCLQAVGMILSEDWERLTPLVIKRERAIKITRYKIDNAKAGYIYDPKYRIHPNKVEFRWTIVRTLVNEILRRV